MQRTVYVLPDESGTISVEMLANAMYRFADMLDIAGGFLEVGVGRAPTGRPGEMVMTHAALRWSDRTDSRERPEKPVSVLPAEGLVEQVDSADTRLAPTDENPDGFDYSKLAAEDVEDEPAGVR